MYQVAGDFYVGITCGYIDDFDIEQRQSLTAEVSHYTSKAFSLDELTLPGGMEAFLGSGLPTKRMFRRGQEPEGDLSDEDFDLAMRNLQEELPAATVTWIHEALRIIQLPSEHSLGRARIDKIMELADAVPEVPLELNTLITMNEIRVVGGLSLEAFWQSTNQTALERDGYAGQYLTQTRIRLNRIASGGQQYFYIRDAYGNETVVAEIADPTEREVLSAIGYDVHSPNDWGMWSQDVAKLGITSPPDSALEDFARRVQDTLINTQRLGKEDRYVRLADGTIKVRRRDGTIY